MPMPEATIYKDYGTIPGKRHIGSSRKTLRMESIAESTGVQSLANCNLRLCVSAFNQ